MNASTRHSKNNLITSYQVDPQEEKHIKNNVLLMSPRQNLGPHAKGFQLLVSYI